jgi:kinesin family protein 1
MNATSSRAHTIITINLVQKYKNPAGKEMSKSSLVNLVDLAGS